MGAPIWEAMEGRAGSSAEIGVQKGASAAGVDSPGTTGSMSPSVPSCDHRHLTITSQRRGHTHTRTCVHRHSSCVDVPAASLSRPFRFLPSSCSDVLSPQCGDTCLRDVLQVCGLLSSVTVTGQD